jgi:hypothetical protein
MSESDFSYLSDEWYARCREWSPNDTEYNHNLESLKIPKDLEEDSLLTERNELPSPDNQVRPYWWCPPPEPEPEAMPPIPDGIDDDWTAWDAWWNDDSLLFVDLPDPEPEFDYSYRRPGWPRLS